MDTKKKERVGAFKNAGRTWRPRGQPHEMHIYDYPSLGVGPAIPYGAYDIARNEGFVNVGVSHEHGRVRGGEYSTYETIINLISTTTTKTGLRFRAKLDPRVYQSRLTISADEMKGVKLRSHRFHPERNYSIAASEK